MGWEKIVGVFQDIDRYLYNQARYASEPLPVTELFTRVIINGRPLSLFPCYRIFTDFLLQISHFMFTRDTLNLTRFILDMLVSIIKMCAVRYTVEELESVLSVIRTECCRLPASHKVKLFLAAALLYLQPLGYAALFFVLGCALERIFVGLYGCMRGLMSGPAHANMPSLN